jgi:acyl-CoA thioesterase I
MQGTDQVTYLRRALWGIAGVLAFVPVPGLSQSAPRISPAIRAAAQLPRLSQALHATHTARILAIGSSSTAGVGASSPSRTYVARLETDLESALTGTDFTIIAHGLSGESAQGAADRMKSEVEAAKPDLVIWQVGTNDAMHHVAMDGFKSCVTKTLAWLKEQNVDVILINPQYGYSLVKDPYYEEVVAAIATIARDEQILLIDRFDTMRTLQRVRGPHFNLSTDDIHMNDEGYRHLAEHVAGTIVQALPQQVPTTTAVRR